MHKPREAEQQRTFRLALLQGTFIRISFAFANSSTVLTAFIHRLTESSVLVGLTGALMPAGWMWPQLFMSSVLEHRERKMPFYILGMSIRIVAWTGIVLLTLLIGARNDLLLAGVFLVAYAIASSSMGISTIPYMDIISKSIEPQRRTRFFSLRNLIGGLFSILIGFLVRDILAEDSPFSFPENYAFLFGCATLAVFLAFMIFLRIHEPVHPVQGERRPLREHLRRGPHFLKTDRNYRMFMIFRVFTRGPGMCIPFYVPYALDRLGANDASVGTFIAVSSFSAVISNLLWAYLGEQWGVRWILLSSAASSILAPLIGLTVVAVAPGWRTWYYYLTFVLSGAGSSGLMVGFMAYMLNLAPPLTRPSYIGFMNTLLFPFSFMPVLAGQLVSWMGYRGMFAIGIVLGIIGCLSAFWLQDVIHDEEFADFTRGDVST